MKKSEKEEVKQGLEASNAQASNQFPMDLSKYRNYIEEIRNKNLHTPEMLASSVLNCIHPEDSIIYNPKNIFLLPTKYPVYPLNLKAEFVENFNDDTLFFIFFIQQDLVMKRIVFLQLQKKGWMFNTKFNTFFQLQGPPKSTTNEYIEGKFKYFDYELDWMIRQKKDFKFEFAHHLETIE